MGWTEGEETRGSLQVSLESWGVQVVQGLMGYGKALGCLGAMGECGGREGGRTSGVFFRKTSLATVRTGRVKTGGHKTRKEAGIGIQAGEEGTRLG